MINDATTVLSVVVGDKDYDLQFTLQDSSGSAVPLTGATLTFEAQIQDNFAVNFNGVMDVISALNGTCSYTVQESNFPVAGVYNVQIVVLYLSGQKITFDNIQVTANPRIPQ